MPFGLCNTGGTFQRVQVKIFRPYLGQFIRVYLDDFAIYGSRSDHPQHVKVAFQRLSEYQCSLSPEKCRFGFHEGGLLGHVVSEQGICVDPDKVRKIREMKKPENRSEVATLMGMATYHNRFILDLAGAAKPITALLKKETPFLWTQDCSQGLKHIQERLASDPVVRQPNWQN